MRSAKTHRHAEALAGSDADFRAELGGGFQQRERQDVGGHDRDRAG